MRLLLRSATKGAPLDLRNRSRAPLRIVMAVRGVVALETDLD